jgi:hypothetical protein
MTEEDVPTGISRRHGAPAYRDLKCEYPGTGSASIRRCKTTRAPRSSGGPTPILTALSTEVALAARRLRGPHLTSNKPAPPFDNDVAQAWNVELRRLRRALTTRPVGSVP